MKSNTQTTMMKMNPDSHQPSAIRLGPGKTVAESPGHPRQRLHPPDPPYDLGDAQKHLNRWGKKKVCTRLFNIYIICKLDYPQCATTRKRTAGI